MRTVVMNKCRQKLPCAMRSPAGECTCLKYAPDPCTFRKVDREITNGKRYPIEKMDPGIVFTPSAKSIETLFKEWKEAANSVLNGLYKNKARASGF